MRTMPTDDPTARHEHCDACGFDGAGWSDDEIAEGMGSLGRRWRALLADAGDELRVRPAPEVWSALEYAAHTRDIVALHRFGVDEALTKDEPAFPPVDPGLADAVAGAYADADPDAVLDELDAQSTGLARLATGAGPGAGTRGLTIGDDRSDVRRLLEHALHDALHHLDDVERGLAKLRTPSSP
jgi:S-DNA-T family DNA segregation ATPase FtsK/SpoIIIE